MPVKTHRKKQQPKPPWVEKLEQGIRGDVHDVAAILAIPVSWVYRNHAKIPGRVRCGKYVRFDLAQVQGWRTNGDHP